MLRSIVVATWAALVFAGSAFAADLGVMPVAVNLSRQADRATVQVSNNGTEPVTLQADAIAWQREQGQDIDGHTDALVINPPVFTVLPGRTQIVRLGLRRGTDDDREATYRLVLREVPTLGAQGPGMVSGNVRVLVALRVPVYVAPQQVRRDERWHVQQDARGDLVAHVTNAGNVHLKVGSLRLSDGSPLPLAEHGGVAVLFPGESRSFRLQPRAALAQGPQGAQGPMRLDVLTDEGLQHVPIELAQR